MNHPLFDRAIVGQAAIDSFRKLNPVSLLKNPVIFVTEVGAAADHPRPVSGIEERAGGLRRSRSPSGSGSRCSSPTSPRRWPRAGARPRPTRSARPGPGPWPTLVGPDGSIANGPGRTAAERRPRRRLRPRDDPGRRRDRRGRGNGGRIGHHRGVRPGHPRSGRRPERGHRRDARPLRPDQGPRHGRPRRRASWTG